MMSNDLEQNFVEIDVIDAKKKLNSKNIDCLIDVREPFEIEICKIDTSINFPLKDIPDRYNELSKEKSILVYCHHGMRSQRAAEFLVSKGFKNVYNLKGGIDQWAVKINTKLKRY